MAPYFIQSTAMTLCAILLAAGTSRRFGPHNKLLAPLPDGEWLAVAAARPLLQTVGQVVAVLRPDTPQLAAQLAALGCRVVEHAGADAGMGSSLAAGIAAAGECDGWLVALADMPHIQPQTIGAVADALRQGAALARPQHHGRPGHPVGFAAQFRDALLALDDDTGARHIVAAHRPALRLIDCNDPGILLDIDPPADLAAWQSAEPRASA